ncbi:hypothetical protein GCM10007315_27210 [Gemmobacter tilapiae]|uniref:Uncharacterized protein n=1 Tax=Neogemmobacter tilapiae TaxID=875041 RepID=A0A918TUC9_9RHOB|nr:hypothetical protein GCM10007315_27210 [Gemmobacter tilapiae]
MLEPPIPCHENLVRQNDNLLKPWGNNHLSLFIDHPDPAADGDGRETMAKRANQIKLRGYHHCARGIDIAISPHEYCCGETLAEIKNTFIILRPDRLPRVSIPQAAQPIRPIAKDA